MNAGATSERVYEALKRCILHGNVPPGARLDPAMLADRLNSSVTPVRTGLNILVGEGLVETSISGGFHLPMIDEPMLKDRYDWNAEIVLAALRGGRSEVGKFASSADFWDTAARTAALFLSIARRTGNIEHVRAVARMNDRLHAPRLVEASIFPDVDAELERMAGLCDQGDLGVLRHDIAAYHRRRTRAAAEILRRLYRMDDVPE